MEEDLYIGLDALRVDFAKIADELKAGKWKSVIVLRYNKPVGVLVSFDRYQQMKAQATPIQAPLPPPLSPVMQEIATYLKPALGGTTTKLAETVEFVPGSKPALEGGDDGSV